MDLVAGRGQIHVALVVVLEGGSVAVVAPAVGFDDHLLLRPEEVDEMPLDQDIDGRNQKADSAPEGQEIDLRDAFRLQRLRVDFEGDSPQLADALASAPAPDD